MQIQIPLSNSKFKRDIPDYKYSNEDDTIWIANLSQETQEHETMCTKKIASCNTTCNTQQQNPNAIKCHYSCSLLQNKKFNFPPRPSFKTRQKSYQLSTKTDHTVIIKLNPLNKFKGIPCLGHYFFLLEKK